MKSDADKHQRMRSNILGELRKTENDFLTHMNNLEFFLDILLNVTSLSLVDRQILEKYRSAIVGLTIRGKTLDDKPADKVDSISMSSFMRDGEKPSANVDVLLKNDFKNASAYYVNTFTIVNLVVPVTHIIDNLFKNNKKAREALNAIKEHPRSGTRGLKDYIIMPVQRPPRYVLILKDLIKYTPQDKVKDLTDALETIQLEAERLNELQREAETKPLNHNVVELLADKAREQIDKLLQRMQANSGNSANEIIIAALCTIKNNANIGVLEKLSQIKQLIINAKIPKEIYKDFIDQYDEFRKHFSKYRLSRDDIKEACLNLDEEIIKIKAPKNTNKYKYVQLKQTFDKAIQILEMQKQTVQLTTSNSAIRKQNAPLAELIEKKLIMYTKMRNDIAEIAAAEQNCLNIENEIYNLPKDNKLLYRDQRLAYIGAIAKLSGSDLKRLSMRDIPRINNEDKSLRRLSIRGINDKDKSSENILVAGFIRDKLIEYREKVRVVTELAKEERALNKEIDNKIENLPNDKNLSAKKQEIYEDAIYKLNSRLTSKTEPMNEHLRAFLKQRLQRYKNEWYDITEENIQKKTLSQRERSYSTASFANPGMFNPPEQSPIQSQTMNSKENGKKSELVIKRRH